MYDRYDRAELCQKIRDVFPEIGECGIDVSVDYDTKTHAYVVDLKRDKRELKTFLEPEDADLCMAGKQCVGLGIQIAQLKGNIERDPLR
jgi:hypothetical protein